MFPPLPRPPPRSSVSSPFLSSHSLTLDPPEDLEIDPLERHPAVAADGRGGVSWRTLLEEEDPGDHREGRQQEQEEKKGEKEGSQRHGLHEKRRES